MLPFTLKKNKEEEKRTERCYTQFLIQQVRAWDTAREGEGDQEGDRETEIGKEEKKKKAR